MTIGMTIDAREQPVELLDRLVTRADAHELRRRCSSASRRSRARSRSAHHRAGHDDDREQHEVERGEAAEHAWRHLGNAHRRQCTNATGVRSNRRDRDAVDGRSVRCARCAGGSSRSIFAAFFVAGAVAAGVLLWQDDLDDRRRRRRAASAPPDARRRPRRRRRRPRRRPRRRGRRGSGQPVTIAFAGDIHFEGELRNKLAADPATVLAPIAPVLGSADLTVANLETAITERGDPHRRSSRSGRHASALTALAAGGIDVASMANNHGMDYGIVGLTDSLAARDAARYPIVGIGRNATEAYAPYRATIKGQRIAVIGATQVLDDNLIAAWTATDTQPGLASAKDVAAPRHRGEAARARRATPSSCSCTGASRRRRARARSNSNWRARSWMRVPTSSSAGTPTACRAPGGSAPHSSATASATSPSTRRRPGRADRCRARHRDRPRHRHLRFRAGGDPGRRAPTARRRCGRGGDRGVEPAARLHRAHALRSTVAVDYDEFGLFRENAAGVRHRVARRPRGARVGVDVGDGQEISALVWGDGDAESCSCTAARRTRTPGTRSRSRSTGRWSRSTSPATGTRRIATITPTGPPRTRSRSRRAARALAPEARVVVGMSLGGLTVDRAHRSRARRRARRSCSST